MTRKQLAALGAVVLIALAAVGIGYGLWFEVLQLDGTVTTGTLDVTIDGEVHKQCINVLVEGMEEPELICEGDPLYDLKTEYGEAVYCEVSTEDVVENDNPDNVDTGADRLVVEVFGAYPGYRCFVEFEVTNEGSVPVHFSYPQIVTDPADPNFADFMEVAGCFEEGYINPPQQGLPVSPHDAWARPVDGSGATCEFSLSEMKDVLSSSGAGIVDGGEAWEVTITINENSPYFDPNCEYLAGLSTYEEYGAGTGSAGLATQWLYSYDEAWMGVGDGSVVLRADMPTQTNGDFCEAQVDWYVGPTLLALSSGPSDGSGFFLYGNRKLGHNHAATNDLPACDPSWQLHSGGSATCVMVIGFTNETVLDGTDIPIAENGAYRFLYEIPAWQWNEDDAAEEMFFSPSP